MTAKPQIGDYYYHYKHDSAKGVLNYAYEIVGLAVHSEDESLLVAYKPLYSPNHVWDLGGDFNVRPLGMFTEQNFESGGRFIAQRFRKIEGQELAALKAELSKTSSG